MGVGGDEWLNQKQEKKTEEGDREFSALGCCFAALCWWEGEGDGDWGIRW